MGENFVRLVPKDTQESVNFLGECISLDGDTQESVKELVRLYDVDPWRRHHSGMHLGEMILFLSQNIDQLDDPETVFGAVLGHDSVYEPWLYKIKGMNENLSSSRTELFLSPHYSHKKIGRMTAYIAATVHHPETKDSDLKYFLDADMQVLGSEPERFARYEEDICEEFTWSGVISRRQYLEGRLTFLESMKDRRIFQTEIAQDLYEKVAHENIEAMALQHREELSQL